MTTAFRFDRSLPLVATLVATLIALSACAKDPTSPGVCTGPLTVSVGRGLQPAITWQPACAASTVAVFATGATAALPEWLASDYSGHGIAPPVQVGASPSGATVWAPGAALGAGAAYTAYVSYGGRDNPDAGTDTLTFTAQP